MIDKRVLAIDCDDVVVATTEAVISLARQVIRPDIPVGNVSCARFWKNRAGFSENTAFGFVHSFELAGYPGLTLMPGAKEAIVNLSDELKIHIVTARLKRLKHITEDFFVKSGLSLFIEDIHYSRNPFTMSNTPEKHEICTSLNAVGLIDDNVRNAVQVAGAGMIGVVFGNNPWQLIPDNLVNLRQVNSWSEVKPEYFDEAV